MKNSQVGILEYKEFSIHKTTAKYIKELFIENISDILAEYQLDHKDNAHFGISLNSAYLQELFLTQANTSFGKEEIEYFNPIDFINSILPVFTNAIMKNFSFTGGVRNSVNGDFLIEMVNFVQSQLSHSLFIDGKHKNGAYLVRILLLSKKITKNLVLKDVFYDKNNLFAKKIKKYIINKYCNNDIISIIKKALDSKVDDNKINDKLFVVKKNNYIFIFNKRGMNVKQS